MVYAKASSQQLELIDKLPDLAELDSTYPQRQMQTQERDQPNIEKFLRDKYVPPREAGMNINQQHNTMSDINNFGNESELVYYNDNTNVKNNETRININDLQENLEIIEFPNENIIKETKNYSEPPVHKNNLYPVWPSHHYQNHPPPPPMNYYNNPGNYNPAFPIMSNYNQYTQPSPYPPYNYNNIINGYSVPVENYRPDDSMINGYSVPVENFDSGISISAPVSRKTKRDFKKFTKKLSQTQNTTSPWASQWNDCVAVANHIQNCPVCSKMYKNNNNQVIYIIIIVVLLIVCLILLQKVLIV